MATEHSYDVREELKNQKGGAKKLGGRSQIVRREGLTTQKVIIIIIIIIKNKFI